MKLKNIFELPEKMDEDIRRWYSKKTKKWEDKGHSKYSLSGIFDTASYISYISIPSSPYIPFVGFAVGLSMGSSLGSLIVSKMLGYTGIEHRGMKNDNGKQIIGNYPLYWAYKLGEFIRAPELIAGAGFFGKGLFDLGSYLVNNDSSSLSEGVNNLAWGTSMVSSASAWYIRDSDPKILDRKPNWKLGLEKIMGGISRPVPQPVPVKINERCSTEK